MSNTALILRPADSPKLWVLEVDGPKHRYTQRGEGSYYLSTNNQPPVGGDITGPDDFANDPRFKDWGSPYWEIYQYHDGSIEVHACRPSFEEIAEGDLLGELGSIIKIAWPCRPILRNALRLARLLCKADPIRGLIVAEKDLVGIVVLQSDIDVYMWRKAATAPTRL